MTVAHSATLEINEKVAAHRREGRPVIHLGFGEAGLPVLPEIVECMRAAATDNRYGSVAGSEPVRAAAAGYWSRRDLPTDPEQIVFGPGSKALLFAALTVLDGDVVLPVPSWVTYAAQAVLTRKRVVGVPIPVNGEGVEYGGIPDLDLLPSALERARSEGADPRILVLTLPDNPTGTVAPPEAIQRVCEIAERENLVIIADEIYRDLTHDGSQVHSPARYLPERTITTSGLSKGLALGGWRIGFMRLPASPDGDRWREGVRGVASEVWSSMSSPMEHAAAYALDEPAPVTERVAASRRLHGDVSHAVAEKFHAAGATLRLPQAGFYLYPDFEALRPALYDMRIRTSTDMSEYLLDQHGLAILPGAAFGDPPEALRFRVATSLLYGDEGQRGEALRSSAPAELPWIRAAITDIGSILAKLPR